MTDNWTGQRDKKVTEIVDRAGGEYSLKLPHNGGRGRPRYMDEATRDYAEAAYELSLINFYMLQAIERKLGA